MTPQPAGPTGIDAWVDRFQSWVVRHRWAAHLWRANDRYNNRLGNQFAGAISYVSVLSSVPVLMLGFSALGFTLTVLRPAWRQNVRSVIEANLSAGPVRDTVIRYLDLYLFHWQSVGLVGLGIGLWAGSVWMGNLKSAVRAMWRPEFDRIEQKRFFPVEMLVNLGLLVALLSLVLVIFGVTSMFTGWGQALLSLTPLRGLALGSWAVGLVSALVSMAGGWLLFFAVFTVLPQGTVAPHAVLGGSLFAAVVFWLFQAATTQLTAIFARNRSAALWGATLIVALLFLNLFARLVLYVAAWIATANQPAVARHWSRFDEPLRGREDVLAVEGHWAAADRSGGRGGGDAVTAGTDRQGSGTDLSAVSDGSESGEDEEGAPPGRQGVPDGHQRRTGHRRRRGRGVASWLAGLLTGVGLGAALARRVKAPRDHSHRRGQP